MLDALAYRISSAVFHQPLLLRSLARQLRRHPQLASLLGIAVAADDVRTVLADEARFSHAHYPEVMLGGPFLIGLPSGAAHGARRQCLHQLLPTPDQVAEASAAALGVVVQNLVGKAAGAGSLRFDLIDDYMAPLVWNALRRVYDAGAEPRAEVDAELVAAARWLGAQLLIGTTGTAATRARALRSAALMQQFYERGEAGARKDLMLDRRWRAAIPSRQERVRDAVGLAWVGHPSTTQGGALILQELLARPAVHAELATAAQALRAPVQVMPPHHRDRLRDHVLELLRFRPPFPLVGRLVPQTARVPTQPGADAGLKLAAGRRTAMLLGALFDPDAHEQDPDSYVPGRTFRRPEDRWLMFGSGPRSCIAAELVVEVLVTALHGLLWLGPPGRLLRRAGRAAFEGPVIVHLPVQAPLPQPQPQGAA